MKRKIENFRNYHSQNNPLILGNIWDVPSALRLKKLGFKALGTSSAAVASMLGYEDGENMTFPEYLSIIKGIVEKVELPITVDLEAGYGNDSREVFSNIKALSRLGVVGINLEDSLVENGSRALVSAEEFAHKLAGIHKMMKEEHVDIFINLRIDTFLLQIPTAPEETLERIGQYSNFVDGIFLPCITAHKDIEKIVEATDLPLNVMCMPALSDFSTLAQLGVKRISMGNFLFEKMYSQLEDMIRTIVEQNSFKPIF